MSDWHLINQPKESTDSFDCYSASAMTNLSPAQPSLWQGLPEITSALQQHDVIVITSGITDFREAQILLDNQLPGRWQRIEWGMGSSVNRSRFHQLQTVTDFPYLPMFLGKDGVIGGMPELRRFLAERVAEPTGATSAGVVNDPRPENTDEPSFPDASWPAHLTLLGFSGLIPFVFFALLSWTEVQGGGAFAREALAAYAAVILSFLGAIHWGIFLQEPGHRVWNLPAPYWAVLPAILAWGALLLSPPWNLVFLLILFPVVFFVDRHTLAYSFIPKGYLRLRGYLTGVASVCVFLALLSGMYNPNL